MTMGAVKDTADAVHFALLMPASLSQSQKYTQTHVTQLCTDDEAVWGGDPLPVR